MIKGNRTFDVKAIEITIEHPISEMGEVPMFVTFIAERDEFIFSFPQHRWSYLLQRNQPIDLDFGPGPFHHRELKTKLIQTMKEAVLILENAGCFL
jgi:hypothetical protein